MSILGLDRSALRRRLAHVHLLLLRRITTVLKKLTSSSTSSKIKLEKVSFVSIATMKESLHPLFKARSVEATDMHAGFTRPMGRELLCLHSRYFHLPKRIPAYRRCSRDAPRGARAKSVDFNPEPGIYVSAAEGDQGEEAAMPRGVSEVLDVCQRGRRGPG